MDFFTQLPAFSFDDSDDSELELLVSSSNSTSIFASNAPDGSPGGEPVETLDLLVDGESARGAGAIYLCIVS
jgi:hypothetical protein